jgi:diacylglycerol kinase (ATP)
LSTVFLVNPAADNGAVGRDWPALQHEAALRGLRGEALLSNGPGRLTQLARDAVSQGATLLCVVGGDGSLNEVVNGVAGAEGVEVAVLPRGTGMDFGRTYGIPQKWGDALDVAVDGRTRTIDVGRVEFHGGERCFANVASAGMSGAVAQRANSMSKALGGRATFFYALTRVFLSWRNSEVTVELDDETRSGPMHDVVVANGQWHGGAMWLAPEAQPDDGLFDVLLIGDIDKLDFATTAPKIYRGKHLSHPKVDLLRSRTVRVDGPVPLPIELDGEQVGTTPAYFEVLPRALRVRVPA